MQAHSVRDVRTLGVSDDTADDSADRPSDEETRAGTHCGVSDPILRYRCDRRERDGGSDEGCCE
jgi:hypothetical protein